MTQRYGNPTHDIHDNIGGPDWPEEKGYYEVTKPENRALAKARAPGGLKLEDAVARAKSALEMEANRVRKGVQQDLAQLVQLSQQLGEPGCDKAALCKTLYRMAHDAKGLGTMLGWPLVSAIAESLREVLQQSSPENEKLPEVVRFHAEAMQSVSGDNPKDAAGQLLRLRDAMTGFQADGPAG